jgi:hypothetical protein
VGRAGGAEIKAAGRWKLAGVAIDGREWWRRRGTLQGALVKGWAFSLFFPEHNDTGRRRWVWGWINFSVAFSCK